MPVYRLRGLLGLSLGQEPPRVPSADAKAYECSPELRSETDLAFKLWVENDPDFTRLIEKHGLGTVLSLVGVLDDAVDEDALVRLNRLLVDQLLAELGFAADDVSFYRQWADGFAESLKKQRAAAGQRAHYARLTLGPKRREQMDAAKAFYFNKAVDYMTTHAAAKKDALLDHLVTLDVSREGIKPRARGVIAQYIAGAIAEGRQRATVRRSGLYDTPRPTGK